MTDKIDKFTGDYRFLSNFHPSEVEYDGDKYPAVEHAYQAAKTEVLADRKEIREATAGKAKRLGAKVVRRKDWFDVSLSIMEYLVFQKFLRHEHLRKQLLATGNAELVEGNDWGDTFWGVCGGKGENHLGKILMKVRETLNEREALKEQAG